MATRLAPPVAPAPATDTAARRSFPLAWVLGIVVAKTALQLAVAGRYGWHRDELYHFAAGKHPSLGYVDFPPLTPLVARLSRALYGDSLVGLRSFAALAGAGVVLLSALLARELGGGRRAQVLAALVAAASPLLLAMNAMFQPNSFDMLVWAGVFYVVARLLGTGGREPRRLWPAVGVLAGFGLLTKYTILALLAALVAGFAVSAVGRAHLRRSGPWLAAGIAAVIALPNLCWQVVHGWSSVTFFTGDEWSHDYTRADALFELVMIAGPVGVALSLAGWWLLARDPRWRALAVTAVMVVVLLVGAGGKGYYAGPVYVLLFAAGAVAVERATPRAATGGRLLWAAIPVALVAALVFFGPQILPLVDEDAMVAQGLWKDRTDYADEIGWEELVDVVADAYWRLPAAERALTGIVADNYGEAGAIDLFGGARGLPPAVSGHLSYRYWPPGNPRARTVVTVGIERGRLEGRCASIETAGVVTNRAGVRNEEYGQPVYVCRLPGTLADVWPSIRQSRDA